MKSARTKILLWIFIVSSLSAGAKECWAFLASNNIPLSSPVYNYLEKLAAFGLITSDFKGIRPYTRAEAARLVLEAERNLADSETVTERGSAQALLSELRHYLPRELSLYEDPQKAPGLDYNPLSGYRSRFVYVDGIPRSYERPVHDPGDDGLFGIGSGLRPKNPYPTIAHQHGTEGTPLMENNEGNRYRRGSNIEILFNSEAYVGSYATALIEPLFITSPGADFTQFRLNKGYAKLGGGGLELEVGRDANWLGLGYRGAITLANNAPNFDLIKLSSPEPIEIKYLGAIKYTFIFSRFDKTVTDGQERQPYFLGAKFSVKPWDFFEAAIDLGRQVGGPGVDNSLPSIINGFLGGTKHDNSNSVGGFELRFRLPFLRNTEIYGEDLFEDTPSVESYVAGIYIPRLSADGRDDLRFEYFLGNNILYTNGTFPEGYIYRGMPIGHSQGGAAQEFYFRYGHYFSLRNNIALEYIHSERGNTGRVTVNADGNYDPYGELQAIEKRNAARAFWNLPLYGDMNIGFMYGWERVNNLNLVGGVNQTNQIIKVDISYRY